MILKGITIYPKPRTNKGYQGSKDKFYQSKEWKQDRALHLQANPICKMCWELETRVTTATVSDHIKPINKGGDKWDWSNRQALCSRHNAIKTALDNPNNHE